MPPQPVSAPRGNEWLPRPPDVVMLLWTTAVSALVPFISLRAKALGMSPGTIGLLLSAPGLIALLTSLVADRVLAAWGPRRLMLTGAVIAAVALAAAGATRVAGVFASVLLVHWGVFPLIAVASQTLVVTAAGARTRDHAVGMHSFYTSLGHPIGPLLAATAVHTWGTEAAAFPMGAAVLIGAAVATLGIPRRGLPATVRTPLIDGLRAAPPDMRTALWAAFVAQFCYDAWQAFYPLALAGAGRSPSAVGVIFASFGVVVPIVRPLLGRLVARIGRVGVLSLAFLCVAFGGVAAALPGSGVAVVACVILVGVGFGLVFPVTMALTAAGAAGSAVSRMLAARFFAMMSGGMLGPVTVGVIASRSVSAAMLTVAVAGAGGLFALVRGRGPRSVFLDTEKSTMLP